MKQIGKTEH